MMFAARVRVLAIGGMVALLGGAVLADSPVADAAMRADAAAVRALVDAGADVNAPQGDGMTALHWAAELGDAETVKFLIDSGANLEAVTRLGAFTPLHVAGEAGQGAATKLLVEAGANPHAVSTLGGELPLHYAAEAGSVAAIEVLLEHGADPNGRSATGQTPLIFAAERNRPEAISVLIRAGADPSLTTVVLDLSRQERHATTAEAARDSLWAMFREDSPDPLFWVPTPAQVQEAMRVAREYEKMEPGFERIDWEKYQLEERSGLSSAQSAGYKGGLTALLFAARQGNFEATEALLEGGADINQQSAGDFTSPLLIAMINGWFDLGLELLNSGADPNIVSDAGTPPLYAVINARWGARPRHPQRMNHLYQNATYIETMEALLKAGADPDARLKKHLWYMAYTSGGGGYLGVDTWGATALWRAAHGLDVEAMKLLVSYGADWDIPSKAPPARGLQNADGPEEADPSEVGGPGAYPVHVVAGYGSYLADNYQRYVPDGWMPAVRYMVEELGADPNILDSRGFNTSHYAAMRGNNELLLYLVEKGADPTVVGRNGFTAADQANGPGQGGVRFDDTLALLSSRWGVEPTRPCMSCADLAIRR